MTVPPERLLRPLDDQQRAAAQCVLGPVCILAGAGTGKTRAITHRIAYGVATGAYAPARVMALTFTSRAAAELRTRLRALGADGVAARTFHAAALRQLNYFWPLVVGGAPPAVLAGKGRLLGQAAEAMRLKADTATLRDVAAEIEWRKVSGLSIAGYRQALASTTRPRSLPGALTAEQAVEVQERYESLKDERRQIDFEDVLLACAGMIEAEPQVAMHVREQYRFFVVDEYQDVSPLQQQLLELWLGDRDDVCVVGDASQTIYSFAGASSEYLLGFGTRYRGATVVRLEQNYRSSAAIVDTANRLMRGHSGSLVLHPHAVDASGPPPRVTRYPDDAAEARGVAAEIAQEVASGLRPETIAVLYRVNAQGAAIQTALQDVGIGVDVRGQARFFELPEVRQALLMLRAASVSVVGEPLFKSVSDVLRSIGWQQQAPSARGAVRDRWESLNAIMGLVDAAAPGTTFRAFTDELLQRQAAGHAPVRSAVTLATLHAAKGLEWDSVHIIGMSEGLLPIGYAARSDQVAEERRLAYVGITRARRRLALSWALGDGRPRAARAPSRFLAELGTHTQDAGDIPRE